MSSNTREELLIAHAAIEEALEQEREGVHVIDKIDEAADALRKAREVQVLIHHGQA